MSVYGKFRRALRSELIAELGVRPGSDGAVRRTRSRTARTRNGQRPRLNGRTSRIAETRIFDPSVLRFRPAAAPRARATARARAAGSAQTSQTRVSRRRARLLFETAVSCLLYARVRVRKRVARFADRACRYTITSQRPCSAVRGLRRMRLYASMVAATRLVV